MGSFADLFGEHPLNANWCVRLFRGWFRMVAALALETRQKKIGCNAADERKDKQGGGILFLPAT
jgi:hypothetical protein